MLNITKSNFEKEVIFSEIPVVLDSMCIRDRAPDAAGQE